MIILLGYLACYTTTVYFHTPFGKITGFCELSVRLLHMKLTGFHAQYLVSLDMLSLTRPSST